MLIFTYGTLMSGNRNHHFMRDARLLGEAKLDGYAMYNLGSYPGCRKMPGEYIFGELYDVGSEAFEQIRLLEDDGTLYVQHRVTVELGNGERIFDVVVFAYNSPCTEQQRYKRADGLWRP